MILRAPYLWISCDIYNRQFSRLLHILLHRHMLNGRRWYHYWIGRCSLRYHRRLRLIHLLRYLLDRSWVVCMVRLRHCSVRIPLRPCLGRPLVLLNVGVDIMVLLLEWLVLWILLWILMMLLHLHRRLLLLLWLLLRLLLVLLLQRVLLRLRLQRQLLVLGWLYRLLLLRLLLRLLLVLALLRLWQQLLLLLLRLLLLRLLLVLLRLWLHRQLLMLGWWYLWGWHHTPWVHVCRWHDDICL